MSFKQIAQLFDAPLGIVVGAVIAVLAAGQIGAMGLTDSGDADREARLDSAARLQRTAVINCLGVSGEAAHQACIRSQRAMMGLDADAPGARGARHDALAPSAAHGAFHLASR